MKKKDEDKMKKTSKPLKKIKHTKKGRGGGGRNRRGSRKRKRRRRRRREVNRNTWAEQDRKRLPPL